MFANQLAILFCRFFEVKLEEQAIMVNKVPYDSTKLGTVQLRSESLCDFFFATISSNPSARRNAKFHVR